LLSCDNKNMNKTTTETVVAIFVGIVLGIIIASGFWYLKNSLKTLPKNTTGSANTTITPQPENKQLFLEINTPLDQTISNEKDLELSGKTNPNTIVILSYNQNDYILRASEQGNFSTNIKLDSGINILYLTAANEKNETKKMSLHIVYEEK